RRQWLGRTSHISVFNLSERLRMAFSTGAHPKQMTSRQHPNAGPPGERLRNVAPQIETSQRGSLAAGIDRYAPRQRCGLGSKPDCARGFCQVKRLDSVWVADKPQLPLQTIP